MRNTNFILLVIFVSILFSCDAHQKEEKPDARGKKNGLFRKKKPIIPGAHRTKAYLPVIKANSVGVLVNQTSRIEDRHLIDTLLSQNVKITRIFTPEHGFEGTADAGEDVENTTYKNTGIEVISLYGDHKKPRKKDMKNMDILVYDIQDVGVRFYTYISTMHYAMEACTENNVKFMVLDRPNPNGDYVDGPVLDTAKFRSFVGMHPVPVVYGMTPAEYATMVNNEGWLRGGRQCVLSVVKMKHYRHRRKYKLPVKPSPNLPNYRSIRLYPSLCFFEATPISVGRGTAFPFQVLGYPNPKYGDFSFVPHPVEGAQNPRLAGKTCYGIDLRKDSIKESMTLEYLLEFYRMWEEDQPFFSRENWFNLLAGNNRMLKQIRAGKSEMEIRQQWKDELRKFKRIREKYLLYRD